MISTGSAIAKNDRGDRDVDDELVGLQRAEHAFTLRETGCRGIRLRMYPSRTPLPSSAATGFTVATQAETGGKRRG